MQNRILYRSCQFDLLAQSVEQLTFNQWVAGSIPAQVISIFYRISYAGLAANIVVASATYKISMRHKS